MGFLDGLKAFGDYTIEFTNRIKTYKTFYYDYEDAELLKMFRYGGYARPCSDAKLYECKVAIKSILQEHGYSKSYLESIERKGGTYFVL